MSEDRRLYVDAHADEAESFYGDGEPPMNRYTASRRCPGGCRLKDEPETMRIVISPVKMGRPAISTWTWQCRCCGRTKPGGRWREDD